MKKMAWFGLAMLCGTLGGGTVVRAQEAADVKKPLAPEAFLEIRRLADPRFSPDGSKVAFVVSEPITGEKRMRHIWLHDRTSDTTRQLTYSTKSETSPRWSPDGKSLAFLSSRGEEQQIYLLPMTGGEAHAVTKGKAGVQAFAWSPDGKQIAYLAPEAKTEAEEKKEKDKDDARVVDKDEKHARIRLLDVASGETSAVTDAKWEIKEMEWLPDGKRVAVIATNKPASDQNTDRIYVVNLADGVFAEVYAPKGPIGRLKVSPDGTTLGFKGAREDGPEPADVKLVAVSGGIARNLTGASLDREVEDFNWAKGGWLIALYADGFHNKFVGYAADGEKKEMTKALPTNPGQFAVAPTGEIAFVGESATAPEELWIRDTSGDAKQVSHLNGVWEHALVPMETFKYKSFDGQEIEAGLLKPAGWDGKTKLPLIVIPHGGPTGNFSDSIEEWGQLLASRGFLVLLPNVRGSTGYGQKFTEANRADWGGADFKDVMAGVDDLIAKGMADPDRLGIGGWSYGGYMSEWAITQTPRFKAAVSGAGMANLISEYGTEAGPSYDEWFWGVPYETPTGFLNSSPFMYLKNVKTPTLILQGEADPVDPLGQSQELYRGLKRYGVETELVVYPREPHGFQEAKHRADRDRRMLEWFEKYVKPEAAKK